MGAFETVPSLGAEFRALEARIRELEARAAAVPRVSSLPATPFDGQTVDYVASATLGLVWRLRYRAGSASAYKWEFVGGSPLEATVDSLQATSSTAYVDLGVVGPSLTAPLTGDYDVTGWADAASQAATASAGLAAVKFGAAATLDTDRVAQGNSGAVSNSGGLGGRAIRRTVAAGTVLKMQYRVTVAVSWGFDYRGLRLLPVRVG